MTWCLLSSEVSSIRYMFASGISSRTRRQTSAPSRCGIIQSRIASIGTAGGLPGGGSTRPSRVAPGFSGTLLALRSMENPISLTATLREHDALLGGLIRNNPVAIVVLDADQRVQLINPAFERLFGYAEGEIAGKVIASLIVPEDSISESNRIAKSGLTGASASTVTHRRRKDGSLVDVEVTFVPFTSTDNRPAGAYVFYRDLSAQRAAERHLRAQYAVIQALANSPTIEAASEWVLRAIAESLEWPVGAMWLVDKTSGTMRCIDFWCHDALDAGDFEQQTRTSEFKRGVGPGRTWDIGAPTWIVDTTKEPKFSRREAALAAGIHAAISFPMILDGDVVGVVEFFTLSILQPDQTMLKMKN